MSTITTTFWGAHTSPWDQLKFRFLQWQRRARSPLTVEEQSACFIVLDASGQALSYVFYEEEPGRRAAAKLLTRDEARRIAANIADQRLHRRGYSVGRSEADQTIRR